MPYQISVQYTAAADDVQPTFPDIEGWEVVRTVSGGSAGEEIVFEGADGVPHAVEVLYAFLKGGVDGGLIKDGYDVRLFEEQDAAAPAAAGPTGPAGPAAKRKSRWGGLF